MTNVRNVLLDIHQRYGELTPETVLHAARVPSHPLHARFEWDDEHAAERYRRDQAKRLIRSVKISYTSRDGAPESIRAFQPVRQPQGYVYEPTERVARDEIASRILLADMTREWQQLRRRYERFHEFWELVNEDASVAS